MPAASFVRATPLDASTLLELMREFYAEEQLASDARCTAALKTLLGDASLGLVYLLRAEGIAVGYMVLTFAYSLERGGKTALLDELFIAPAHRRRGLGAAAVDFAMQLAQASGCHALHLEVAHANAAARSLYARFGFQSPGRDFLTVDLQ